jgi:hypothetical protein
MGKADIFTRRTKREEVISRQPSEPKAFEIAEEWAETICKMHMQDRFGVKPKPVGRHYWDVVLVDRSIAA